MSLGPEGAYLVSVLWGLTGLVLFFLVLRIYTRVVCLAQYGIDDSFYVFTCVRRSCLPRAPARLPPPRVPSVSGPN